MTIPSPILTIGGSCLNVSFFICCSPLVSRVTFSLQVEAGFKSRAFEPHPRSSRDDDSLFMLAILSVHTSSCRTAKRPHKKNEYLRGILGHRRQDTCDGES